jgi:hypothetical protein
VSSGQVGARASSGPGRGRTSNGPARAVSRGVGALAGGVRAAWVRGA